MDAGLEFGGATLEEALRAASSALGIPVDQVHYEMLEEGRKGLFGLGARQVRIRVETSDPGEVGPGPAVSPVVELDAAAVQEAGLSVQQTVERMIGLMGLDLEVRVTASGSDLRLQLEGPDRRMLVQKDGQLLSALSFLLNRMARRAWPEVGRIQVKCEGQRGHRDEELVELVREVASQVARTGEPRQLHPMNPYERRLAHIAVQEFPGLTSRSEGDGFLKRVIVEKGVKS